MLVVLFCLVTFTRAAISYISNNLIGRMMHRIESNSDDKPNDKERQGLVPEDDASESDTKSVAQSKTGSANKSRSNLTAVDGLMSPKFRPRNNKNSSDQVKPSTSRSTSLHVRNMDEPDVTKLQDAQIKMEDENEDENENENASSMKQKDPDSEILHFPTPKDSSFYVIDRVKRGKCVIFNQMEFDSGCNYRKGSNFDVDAIMETFPKLGFDIVDVHQSLPFIKIMNAITKLSTDDYSDSDCLCVFVLTHGGNQGRVYARDMSYPFENIWYPFTECPTLMGKPKLFFVQACRGSYVEEGVKGKSVTDSHDTAYSIPTHADFLFGYSTVEGFYSWRQETGEGGGSWYIQSLCQMIDKHWKHADLVKILTMVSRKVAFEYESSHNEPEKNKKKQMPTFSSTLTRDLYFNLPKDQPSFVLVCLQHIMFQLSQLVPL